VRVTNGLVATASLYWGAIQGFAQSWNQNLEEFTEKGKMLIATLEQRRADAQLSVMEYYSAEEQAIIKRAMALLAEAGQRKRRRYAHPESNATE
jgi:hypothetical protein